MMLGNIEYINNWVHPYHSGLHTDQTVSFIMLMLFILLMPILLINLLVRVYFKTKQAFLTFSRTSAWRG